MALIDKASLLMVPSTYEAGKLYNVLPSGNRAPDSTGENSGYDQTRADFDFDRGSNAAATRIGSDGLIKKYRENVLTQSNNFSDSDWTLRAGASVAGGQSGYDGTNNAWLLNADTTGTFRFINQATNVNTILTNSIYAKAGSVNYIGVTDTSGSSSHIVYFDLSNGTIDSVTGGSLIIDYKIESVGNGWYRCSASLTAHSSGTTLWFVSATGGSNANAGNNIYIQNAQSESSLVATDYLESTSVTGKAGVLIDLPRIDYSSGAGALLLEPQRANLITQSEYFDASQWIHYYSTISSNDSTSPDGFENATRWTSTASGTFLTTSLFISDPCNLSVFVKYVDHPYIQLYSGASGGDYANFDIQNKTIGTSGYNTSNEKIESYGNGWYRISCTFANVSAGSTARIGFAQLLTSNWGGLNTSAVGDVLIYGAQLEAGSYSTSYIPNHGTSGGVTRAADSCSVTGVSDVIGQTEGTLFWEVQIDTPVATANEAILNIDGGFFGNTIYISKSTTGNIVGEMYVSGGSSQASFTLVGISAGSYKIAFAYAQNNTAMYVNGVQVGATDTSCNVPATSRIQLGNTALGPSTDKTKQVALFNERLSNAELAALTA